VGRFRVNFTFTFYSQENVERAPQFVGLSDESFGDIKSNSPTSDDLGSLPLKNLSVQFLNTWFLVMNCNDVNAESLLEYCLVIYHC
jgi:hypothetical protein